MYADDSGLIEIKTVLNLRKSGTSEYWYTRFYNKKEGAKSSDLLPW